MTSNVHGFGSHLTFSQQVLRQLFFGNIVVQIGDPEPFRLFRFRNVLQAVHLISGQSVHREFLSFIFFQRLSMEMLDERLCFVGRTQFEVGVIGVIGFVRRRGDKHLEGMLQCDGHRFHQFQKERFTELSGERMDVNPLGEDCWAICLEEKTLNE